MRNCLFIVCSALFVLAARADTIIVRGQPAIAGVKVKSETLELVTYVQGGKSKELPAASVLAIVYDGPPRDYRLGVENYNLGDFVNAVERLKTVAGLAKDEKAPWLPEYANYFLGRSYLAAGDFDKAAEAFAKVIALHPDGRLVAGATLGLARAKSGAGKADDARAALGKLKDAAAKAKGAEIWVSEAMLALAEVEAAAQKAEIAANLAHDLAGSVKAVDSPEARALFARAKVLEYSSLLEAKDAPKARNVMDDLKDRVGKGDRAAEAAEKLCRATDVLANSSATDDDLWATAWALSGIHAENFDAVSQLPRTCYFLGLVHLRLAKSLPAAKDAAKGYFTEVRRRFPESREALLARDELKKM